MESQPKTTSKEELIIRRIMELRQKGLGCRRIAATLQSEGVAISKDKVWRTIREHTVKGDEAEVKQERRFKRLAQKERVLQKRLEGQLKKREYRRRIVNLIVGLVMTNYEERRELFLDERKLLRFAETVMPFVDAQLWTDFKRHCDLYGLDLAHQVFEALGLQRHFEEQFEEDSDRKMKLDAYLGKKIKETYRAWNETTEDEQETEEEERCQNEQDSEQEEKEWLDAEGYWHIPLRRAPDDNDESL